MLVWKKGNKPLVDLLCLGVCWWCLERWTHRKGRSKDLECLCSAIQSRLSLRESTFLFWATWIQPRYHCNLWPGLPFPHVPFIFLWREREREREPGFDTIVIVTSAGVGMCLLVPLSLLSIRTIRRATIPEVCMVCVFHKQYVLWLFLYCLQISTIASVAGRMTGATATSWHGR